MGIDCETAVEYNVRVSWLERAVNLFARMAERRLARAEDPESESRRRLPGQALAK